MIRSIGLFCVLCLLSILTSCHTTSSTDQDLPPYNPNVEAFTTGKISRYSPVYLIFNQEIPADRLKADRLGKLVRLKPDVPGKWAFENNRTLVFKPEKGFERNTTYPYLPPQTIRTNRRSPDKRCFAQSLSPA